MTLDEYLACRQEQLQAALEEVLPPAEAFPPSIHSAMRYSVFAGGKRIRPVLMLAAAEAVRGDEAPGAVRPACALELIHTYSLIHDDLPALDNDELRRGRPTCHKVYGEAIAILAGDALLTLAFQVISECEEIPPARRLRMISEIARAAGTVDGMIGGQVADLEASAQKVDAAGLEYIHRAKTGALIRASVAAGALYADAAEKQLRAAIGFGRHIGLAFQIVDDILDQTQPSEVLGKTAGKDAAQQKATFPAVHGLEESRRRAEEHFQRACEAIESWGERALRLRQIAERIVHRST